MTRSVAAPLLCCLVFASGALAKEIRPGDLSICGSSTCRPVRSVPQARAFSGFLWGTRPLARAPDPRLGSPVFQLRSRDGAVLASMTATAIRVYGVNCGRFRRGAWYSLPRPLLGLTRNLAPRRLIAKIPRSC